MGAESPEDAGLYFSWGNTDGHRVGDGYEFTQNNYDETTGSELEENIPLDNDAAYLSSDDSLKIPTKDQLNELTEYTTKEIFTQGNLKYIRLTSDINGNSLTIPWLGSFVGGEFNSEITAIWTNHLELDENTVFVLEFWSNVDDFSTMLEERINGFNIRPVAVSE